jgi:hypothetical protein
VGWVFEATVDFNFHPLTPYNLWLGPFRPAPPMRVLPLPPVEERTANAQPRAAVPLPFRDPDPRLLNLQPAVELSDTTTPRIQSGCNNRTRYN